MSEFLSEDWFRSYEAYLAKLPWKHTGEDDLVVGVEFTNAEAKSVSSTEASAKDYKIRFSPSGIELLRGSNAKGLEPNVIFAQQVDTAASIASGELSAQHGFKTGALRVRGDSNALIANLEGALEAIGQEQG